MLASPQVETDSPLIGVYLHVPYCRTICPYCDFLRDPVVGAPPDAYVDALLREIDVYDGPVCAQSVFFGGGTPSLLTPRQLERILGAIFSRFAFENPEISLEANADDITPELLHAWQALDIHRISIGVQSFDDAALRHLGRRHDAATARRACAWVAERFGNWSLDLIFGARPVEAWRPTLEEAGRLAPPHVSAYGLTYEAGTPFEAQADKAIDEDTYLELYGLAEDVLGGCRRYEVSSYAVPGFECRHNLVYWQNREYAGFGTGAYSFLHGVRSRNMATTEAYLADPGAKGEVLRLSDAEIRVETVIQHLRLKAGLPKDAYRRRFGANVQADFGRELDALAARGLIEEDEETLRPTRLGFELNDEIGLELVSARRVSE
ncbi:MAG TPA: radical SAM family heme chaperone HemW [Candidatus Hydrogenedentes bacterium]|nr:radical SAM family heme chaperone HemW [Candidatus Hydrogenedentota bacterium]